MRSRLWSSSLCARCALVVAFLGATAAFGAVTADPPTATFTAPEQSATIALTRDGAPLPARDMGAWQFLASGHDYKHMLNLEKRDGAIIISPSATMEVGSYDLTLQTSGGTVVVRVYSPFSDLPDIIATKAALTGKSEEKVREELGMTTPLGREQIHLETPAVHYEGQTLEITMPVTPGRTSLWFINGEQAAVGPDQNTLSHTFLEPGEYVLDYVEGEKREGVLFPIARATAHVRVVSPPEIATEIAVNTSMRYNPPAGYRHHVWHLDGEEVSREPVLQHTFRAPGVYRVECLATGPDAGPAQGFQRVRYRTTVR